MTYTRDLTNLVGYGSTISEATGYGRRSSLEKYCLIGAKLLFSVLQDKSSENVIKEVGQAGLSVLCDIGGRATGDMQGAAQAELFSNVVLDVATSAVNYNRRGYW